MAINIDTVYQKVLTLANKEQRGYITPQEFNLLADKAQLDMFGSYFHDMKTAYHKPHKTDMIFGDEMGILKEKVAPFETNALIQTSTSALTPLPADMYLINTIIRNFTLSDGSLQQTLVTEVNKKDWYIIENNPLTKANSTSRSTFVRINDNQINVVPAPTVTEAFVINYFKTPTTPNWGYVVVNEKALYNNATSTDFELHVSEEEALVTRILELAGLVIRSEELAQAAMVDKANTKQTLND